jgi:hypothetical protein
MARKSARTMSRLMPGQGSNGVRVYEIATYKWVITLFGGICSEHAVMIRG